jgi:hypothetical protein
MPPCWARFDYSASTFMPTGEPQSAVIPVTSGYVIDDREVAPGRGCMTVLRPVRHGGQPSTTWGNALNANRNARALAITATTLALGLGACSSTGTISPPASSPSAVPPSTVTLSTTAASPADTAKQKAVAAYVGMWSDMADAAVTSDWQSPKLAQNATAEALQTVSRSLYADHYNGLVTKGRPVNRPEVSSVDPQDSPTSVTVTDCGDSTNWLKYRADNGQPANDGPGGRRHIEALVKKAVDGSWKVTTFAVYEVGSCTG